MPRTSRPADDRHEIYVALGAAIRRARGKQTQKDLAKAIDSDQTTISYYELGHTRVTLDVLIRIVQACEITLGDLLLDAGLIEPRQVPTETSTEAAIRADPELDDAAREAVLHVYKFARRDLAEGRPWLGEVHRLDTGDGQPEPEEDPDAGIRHLLDEIDTEYADASETYREKAKELLRATHRRAQARPGRGSQRRRPSA